MHSHVSELWMFFENKIFNSVYCKMESRARVVFCKGSFYEEFVMKRMLWGSNVSTGFIVLIAFFCFPALAAKKDEQKPVRYVLKINEYYWLAVMTSTPPSKSKGETRYTNCYNVFVIFQDEFEGKHRVLTGISEEAHRYLISLQHDTYGEMTPWINLREVDVNGGMVTIGYRRGEVPFWCTKKQFEKHPCRLDAN